MPDITMLQEIPMRTMALWGGAAVLMLALVVFSWSFLRIVAKTAMILCGVTGVLFVGVMICEWQGWMFEKPVILPRVQHAVQQWLSDIQQARQTASLPESVR